MSLRQVIKATPLAGAFKGARAFYDERLAIFSQQKVLANPLLNLLGTQVFRILLARSVLRLRRSLLVRGLREKYPECKVLASEGIIIIPDFLPEDDFQALRAGFERTFASFEAKDVYKGRRDTEVNKINLSESEFPEYLRPLIQSPKLKALLGYGEGRNVKLDSCWLERIRHAGAAAARPDPQLRLHRDIYFSSHKMLFYVNEVTTEKGPFVYVERSNRIRWSRLWMEYVNSLRFRPSKNLRALPDEGDLGMKARVIEGRANTLVIADVFGFHRRGPADPGQIRETVRLGIRSNPFIDFSGAARSSRDGD